MASSGRFKNELCEPSPNFPPFSMANGGWRAPKNSQIASADACDISACVFQAFVHGNM